MQSFWLWRESNDLAERALVFKEARRSGSLDKPTPVPRRSAAQSLGWFSANVLGLL